MLEEQFLPPKPPEPFIGRTRELDWLEREAGFRDFGRRQPLVITGDAGVGKTALVTKYLDGTAQSLIDKPWENRRPPWRRIRDEETQSIWIPANNYSQRARNFESIMRAPSDRIPEFRIVVLDGAEALKEEEQHEAISHILNFKRVSALIITSRTNLEVRGEPYHLTALPKAQAESLLTGIAQTALTTDAIDQLLNIADGSPLALKLLGELAKTRSQEELRQLLNGHLYDIGHETIVTPGKLVAVAKPLIITANEAMVRALKKQPKDVYRLTPRQYEELIAELFRDMGYDVTLTKATRDGGKDILASQRTEIGQLLYLIEAKRYREDRKIGVSLVRGLYGTLQDHGATSAIMVTTSSYSRDAHALQQRHQYQLSLKEYTDVADWIQSYGKNKRPT